VLYAWVCPVRVLHDETDGVHGKRAEQENVDKLKRQLAEACAERDDVSKENAQLRAFIEQLRVRASPADSVL